MPRGKKVVLIQMEVNGNLVEVKECTKCKNVLPLDEYHNDQTKKSGKQAMCKACKNQKNREYQQANRERIRKRRKQYEKENVERIREVKRKYREENKEWLRELTRKWKEENKEYVRQYNQNYQRENAEYIRQYSKKYRWERVYKQYIDSGRI